MQSELGTFLSYTNKVLFDNLLTSDQVTAVESDKNWGLNIVSTDVDNF